MSSSQSDPWTAAQTARIDWPKVLEEIAYLLGEPLPANELLRAPVSQNQLAANLGFSRGSLRNWMEGSEPRHSDGEALLAHWCRLTGKARTFVPVDRYMLSSGQWEKRKEREAARTTEEPSESPAIDRLLHGREGPSARDSLRAALHASATMVQSGR